MGLNYSPHAKVREVRVQGQVVPQSEVMDVMGVAFKVGASPSELIAGPLGMARNKFWKLKHLLINDTPLHKRMVLFDRVITSSAL